MQRHLRLVALLARVTRLDVAPTDQRIVRRPLSAPCGLEGDVWEPRRGATDTFIALHGATLNGRDDRRLQAFGRAVAASGIRCVLPSLPGLASVRFEAGGADAVAVAALSAELAARHGPPVLVGFSFGGSCALLAASRPAARLRYVLTFGAAASYEALFDELRERWRSIPSDPRERRERLYVMLLMAYRRAVRLGLEAERAALEAPFRRFCSGLSDDESAALAARLEPIAPIESETAAVDLPALRAASPAGQLESVRCPTGVLHDPRDLLVPAHHAEALAAELRRARAAGPHRLLVTRLLDHVDLRTVSSVRFAELAVLARILAPLTAPGAPSPETPTPTSPAGEVGVPGPAG